MPFERRVRGAVVAGALVLAAGCASPPRLLTGPGGTPTTPAAPTPVAAPTTAAATTAVASAVAPTTAVPSTAATTAVAPPTSVAPPPPPTAPTVGECWSTLTDATYSMPSNPSPSTPCASAHALETLAVATVTGPAAAEPAPPTDPAVFTTANGTSCGAVLLSVTQKGPAPIWDATPLPVVYLPSAAEWTAGARWTRCDAAVLTFAKITGRQQSERRFALRKGKLSAADPASPQLRLCASRAAGANGVVQYVESCDHSHNAEFSADFTLGKAGAPYPGKSPLQTRLTDICRQRLTGHAASAFAKYGAYISGPDETSWDGGDHVGQCLVNTAPGMRGTVID